MLAAGSAFDSFLIVCVRFEMLFDYYLSGFCWARILLVIQVIFDALLLLASVCSGLYLPIQMQVCGDNFLSSLFT